MKIKAQNPKTPKPQNPFTLEEKDGDKLIIINN